MDDTPFATEPGDPLGPPGSVAPHQPRVDFQLWFHGFGFQRRTPDYVRALVKRLYHDPAAVQSLFREPLPGRPDAVRIAYVQYHFTTPRPSTVAPAPGGHGSPLTSRNRFNATRKSNE